MSIDLIDFVLLLFTPFKLDRSIQKKKHEFKDPTSGRALQKLNESLSEVTSIMRQNVEDILQRGEDLTCDDYYLNVILQTVTRYTEVIDCVYLLCSGESKSGRLKGFIIKIRKYVGNILFRILYNCMLYVFL